MSLGLVTRLFTEEYKMKNTPMPAVLLAAAILLSGCAATTQHAAQQETKVCGTGDPMVQTTLYFGLNRPTGPVITAAEWQGFVDRQVTPRFKDGLSVFDAKGQWLGNDGKLARENSKALMLIYAPGKGSETNIEALRSSYKQQFAQDSVMRVDAPVCVEF